MKTYITTGDQRCKELLFDEPRVIEAVSLDIALEKLQHYLESSWGADSVVTSEFAAARLSSMRTEYPELSESEMIALLAEWKKAEVMRGSKGTYQWRTAGHHGLDQGWIPFRQDQIDSAIYHYVKENT